MTTPLKDLVYEKHYLDALQETPSGVQELGIPSKRCILRILSHDTGWASQAPKE